METLQGSPVTAAAIQAWTACDPTLSHVRDMLKKVLGYSGDPDLRSYQRRHTELSVQRDRVLWGSRVVVPNSGRAQVMAVLHKGHPGICHM